MFPKQSAHNAGMTLVETVIAVAVGSLALVVLASFSVSSGRTFVLFAQYYEMSQHNRQAVDTLSRELRSAREVIVCTTNSLTLADSDGVTVRYVYDSADKTLTRIRPNEETILLTGCDSFAFSLRQRTPVGGEFEAHPTASPATCKVVDFTWNCSRNIYGMKASSDDMQTARVVIRQK